MSIEFIFISVFAFFAGVLIGVSIKAECAKRELIHFKFMNSLNQGKIGQLEKELKTSEDKYYTLKEKLKAKRD